MFTDGGYSFHIYANDHEPPLGHLIGNGYDIRIGQNGKPTDDGVRLTSAQQGIVDNNIKKIRSSLRAKMAEHNRNHPKDPKTGLRCR
jgi:hypothetical protein